jgi:7-cyano-7-deazaguanine synthase
MPKAIVLFSGGIDSTTALFWAIDQGFEVIALSFNYPSRAQQELQATRRIVHAVQAQYIEASLPFLHSAADLMRYDPKTFHGIKIPEGYIPARNMIFYALATYYCEIYGAEYIIAGHLETDSIGFPDATPAFFQAIESIINMMRLNQDSISSRQILLPFLTKSKTEVIQLAVQLKVPLELTWSCYYDNLVHCEKCESCLERKEAFDQAEINDPLKNRFFS